jgi:hypothetical protein
MYVGQMNFGTVPVKILEEGEALEWLFERDYKTFFRLLEVWDRDRKPLQVIIRRPRYHSGRDLFLHVMLQKGVRLPPSFIYQIDHPSDLFKFGRMTLNRFFDLKEESYFAYTNLLSVFTTIFHGDNGLAFLPFFRELKRFDWDIDNKLPPDIIHTIKNLE